jgi:TOTE conflict system primase-like protein
MDKIESSVATAKPFSARHELLLKHFFNRKDTVQVATSWGYGPATRFELGELIRAHLGEISEASADVGGQRCTGAFRIGAHAQGIDGRTKWACVDIDGPNHPRGVKDPDAALSRVQEAFRARGITGSMEKSHSGQGWHLWIFFEGGALTKDVRRVLLALLPRDVELASDGTADPEKSIGIELFPKQDTVPPGGFGSAMSLPFFQGVVSFYHRATEGAELTPHEPASFDTVSVEALQRLVESLPSAAPPKRAVRDSAATRSKSPWRDWRAQTVAALNLEDVYGAYLTGKAGKKGWLGCRDPASPSGDKRPSASVADSAEGVERGTFHSFIECKNSNVFDFLVERGEVEDFNAACAHLAKLTGIPVPTSKRDPRPEVLCGRRQHRDVVHDAWEVIRAENWKRLRFFRHGGVLVRLAHDVFEPVTHDWLFAWLASYADWVKETKSGEVASKPDKDVVRSIIIAPSQRIPLVNSIEHAPYFDRTGKLVEQPGYNAPDETYYAPPKGWHMERVKPRPSADDVAAAKSVVDELIADFPFVGLSDRAHALSALLTPMMRRLFDGPTPLHLFEAPTPGTGKSLLCELISRVVQGKPVEAGAFSSNQEEHRKRITAALLQALRVILWDNVDSDGRAGRIESRALATVLTSLVWNDRLLGTSKSVTLPNNALWLMTGNNPQLSMELARRAIRIRLDTGTECPWRGRSFRHADIAVWVDKNRSRLVHALLTLVGAWLAKGRPPAKVSLGRFEGWASVVGGALEVAGYDGFLANLDEFYEVGDTESSDLREFVASWWAKFGSAPKSAAELMSLRRDLGLMADLPTGASERSALTTFGIKLRSMRDRVFDGKRVALSPDREKPYCLKLLEAGACSSSDSPEHHSTGPASTSGYLDEVEDADEEPREAPASTLHDDTEFESEGDSEQDDPEAKATVLNESKPDNEQGRRARRVFDDDDDDFADLEMQLTGLTEDDEVAS